MSKKATFKQARARRKADQELPGLHTCCRCGKDKPHSAFWDFRKHQYKKTCYECLKAERTRRNQAKFQTKLSEMRAHHGDYINSPEWRAKKREFWNSDRPRICYVCGTSNNLELHHLTYERFGQERLEDLVPLCRAHHQEVTNLWEAEKAKGMGHIRREKITIRSVTESVADRYADLNWR